MTPERWQRVKQVFQSVMDRDPEDREAFLGAACADDPSLRSEVESLIAAHDRPWDFIESPAFESSALETPSLNFGAPHFDEQPRLSGGQTLDHYRVIAPLGAGGMGEVYLAVDTRLDRQAAVKLLPSGFTHDPDRLRRFIQEAKAASALNHPNIITIYDIGRTGETWYIGAEFIDGETLRQRMSSGKIPLYAALEITIQTASALVAAHDAGIVHRDIKPENVMLRRDGYVKVLDFGLAKLAQPVAPAPDDRDSAEVKPQTRSGTIMGTVGYMSPEQARGLKVDARTDIFSLGVVLYEMLAGCAPFTGETTTDVLVAILEREPTPLERHAPATPPELQRIVGRMLAKRREERYQSSRDLLHDLKELTRELDLVEHRSGSSPSGSSENGFIGAGARTLTDWIARHRRTALVVAVLLIAAAASLLYFIEGGGGRPAIGSIAVLPFENVGGNPEMEYLSDGITESLINSLSQISQLRVMARATVFTYKGRQIDLKRVGGDLNVDAVLTGKVTQRGETLTIQADLVYVDDGSQLWGDRYQHRISEVMAVQEGIAREISERLRLRLSGAEQQRLTKRYTDNPAAYFLYLKGRHHNNKRTQEGFQRGLESFQQAIDLDPNYAQAYAGMADTYALIGNFSFVRPRDVRPKAEAAARKALELDPELVEGLSADVYLNIWSHDWEAVERGALRAIELNANYPGVRSDYGLYLALMGRYDEAKQQFARARELDPLSATRSYSVARCHYWMHQYDESIREFQQTLELDRGYWLAHFFMSFCYMYKGETDRAIAEGLRSVSLSDSHQAAVGALGMAYAAAGRRVEARRLLDDLLQRSKQSYISGYYIAQIHNALGDADQVFAWLEKVYDEGYGMLPYVKVDPNWDNLRRDPRYTSLMQRIGLAP